MVGSCHMTSTPKVTLLHFYNSNFSIPNERVSQPIWKSVLEEISFKMTSVQGCRRPCHDRSSAAPSITLSDSFPPPEVGDELSDQPARPLGTKPPFANALAATSVLKYSKDDLQRIFKAILGARALVPALAPIFALAPIVAKAPWEKLKVRSPDVYRRKSHINCYNFCQQCEDYFATTGITGPTRILFAASFLRDWISFRWQQYKRKHATKISISVT